MHARNLSRRSILPLLGAFLLLLGGCAPAAESTGGPRPNPNLITREEMAQVGASDLYEVVQRLRPQWLRPPRATSIRGAGMLPVMVYQGNTQLGGAEVLRQMTPGYATALRFLDGPEASNTLPGLGSRTVAGAIVIVLPS